ncbi:hypothetical protein [Streptomyces sp. SAJ15]|uniref:hypothetical protein n=1 Tax=Streptomyces sp. SAJ15 TaxID=2011095 RepID=UPI0011851210|nr:hypothetical protein [Streptomyces sp. SAJ15]TVL94262.1 hypothetical protein CD790_04605 [Streptomyces sp. SAJ15]
MSHRAALAGSLLYAAVGPLALALAVSPETPYRALAVLLSLFNTGLGIGGAARRGRGVGSARARVPRIGSRARRLPG